MECRDDNYSGTWQAGFAKVDITPPIGVWLMGFGARLHGATGMHDPLYATALVLCMGAEKIAIVSCDLLALNEEHVHTIRTQVAAVTDIQPENIMVHTTHTHAGPLVGKLRGFGEPDAAYESVLLRKTASAIILANQRLEPVTISYGMGHAAVGINRRARLNKGAQIGENPQGAYDDRVATLGFRRADGSGLVGCVLWAVVHPVMLGDGNYCISRDIPGKAVDRLEAAYPGSICLYLTGPTGNINQRDMTAPEKLEMVDRHGTTIAGAALMALATGRQVPPERLVAESVQVDVPLMPLPSAQEVEEYARITYKSIKDTCGDVWEKRVAIDYRLRWAEDALASIQGKPGAERQQTHIQAEFQMMILGDVVLTTLPFEAFVEYQGIAEASAPYSDSLVVAYTNGNFGYMFTDEAFKLGGYEVTGAFQLYGLQRFTAEAPAAVTAGIRRLHAMMRK
jgi:neutral ceramidase